MGGIISTLPEQFIERGQKVEIDGGYLVGMGFLLNHDAYVARLYVLELRNEAISSPIDSLVLPRSTVSLTLQNISYSPSSCSPFFIPKWV